MLGRLYTPAPYHGRGYCNTGELGTPKGWLVHQNREYKKLRPPTLAGLHMLQAVPPEGIDEYSLIKKLDNTAADDHATYENYKRGIEELVRTRYLIRAGGIYKHAC